ncbi:VCBS repeat-containing protein [Bradyrhizobium sp. S3.12.5]
MNYAGKFDGALSLDSQGSRSPASHHVDSFTAKSFTATGHGHVPEGAVVIPDPNLIFNGEFKRTGVDLVLSHDGHEFVVHDYFRGDKRAAIASPDGAHLTGDIVNALTGHVQYAQAAPGAAAAEVIGHVTKLTGSATAIRNGVSVILNNGDNVEKGDVVSTGSDSTLGVTFIDGTVFGLSSNARMVLNDMVYDPNGSNNSSLLSLVAGTITFVAGETAKHGDMKIDTPVATMGIRGTAVLTEINFVVPSGGGDPQPQANFQVLVEPNGTTGSYILFDKLTLLPIATVNQAGQMIQISGGNVSITNGLLSPDVQKLITDVFTLKFTDNNTNTKLTTNFTDSITQNGNIVFIKTDTGATATATFTNTVNNGSGSGQGGTDKGADRFPGPPQARSLDANGNVTSSFLLKEHANATADHADTTGDTVGADTVSGRITFVDLNLGDRPTVSVNLAQAPNFVYENAGQQDVTGSLTALQKQDIAATQIQIGVVADGANNNNGSAVWTYTMPDHVFDFLAAGETLTLTYMVRIDNNFSVNPETTFIPITISITGTNDKPTIATSGGTVIEKVGTGNEALDTITGAVTFTDVDLTDRPIVSAALSSAHPFKYLDAHGNDVTATLTPEQKAAIAAVEVPLSVVQGAGNANNGSATWTYSVTDHLFDFLADGETLVLNYVIQVDDGHGGVVSTPITVSINGADVSVEGTNDVPTIVGALTTVTGAVKEDAAATLLAGGTITFNDPDLTDTHTASFVLKSTTSSAHLPGFSDGTSQIGAFALTAVSESPGVSTVGSLGWSFTLDDSNPVLQSLAEGQTITQIYTVTVDDHHGGTVTQDVTVTITGTNDVPTITSSNADATGGVTEDAATPTLSSGGTLAIQDLDLIDTHTAAAVFKSSASSAHLPGFTEGATNIGTFTIDPSVTESSSDTNNGATLGWHFSLADNDPVLQSLAEGQTITQVYTVTFTDNHGATVSKDVMVTITGTNDTPTITSDAAAAAGAVTEDAATPTLSTGGTLAIQDLDLIDTHTAQAAFKSSASSAHLPGFSEGTTNIGTFTIDPSVTESSTDTNNGATLGWHFSLADNDPVLQSLAQGQTITQVYTVTFTDNHGATVSQDVTVTIIGTNDTPTITSSNADATGGVTEDAATPTLSTGGTLAIQDLDLIDTHTAAAVFKSSASSAHLPGFTEGTTNIGTFTIDPSVTESSSDTNNGATLGWHFSLADNDPVLQSLAEGQTITQVYTVTFTDNQGATVSKDVTVTITGTNDVPTVTNSAAAAKGAVTEDTGLTLLVGGTLAIQDLDLIDTHTATAAFKSATSDAHLPGFSDGTSLGTFTIDSAVTEFSTDTDNSATLGWHFSLDDNSAVLQSLAQGQSITEVYTVTITDDHGAHVSRDVTVTINGANDAPTITSGEAAAEGAVTEDDSATLSIDGTLAIQDLDLIDTHTAEAVFKSSTSSAHLPGFSDGTSLGTFTIDSSVTEFSTDTDNSATLGWHFSLNNNSAVLQSLAQGQSITEVYTVTFTDDHGAHVSQDVTVTINGANDAPTITSSEAAAKGAVTEDASATLSIDGALAIQDIDLIDTHTAAAVFKSSSLSSALPDFDSNSHIGSFTIDPSVTESNSDASNGATLGWHFSLDDSDPTLQSLAQGQTITQVYTVAFTDNHGAHVSQDVTVTITGTNDAPTLADVTAGALTDTAATDTFSDLTGTLAGADVDNGETATLVYSAIGADNHGSVAGHYGSLTVNADGTYDYAPDAAAINALSAGPYADTFTVQTTDAHGTTSTATFAVNVTGANDVPTISNATLDAVSEDAVAPAGSTVGALFTTGFHDADAGANLKAVAVTADHADESQGVWQYEVAGSNQWIDISGVSDTSALVLATDALIRFVPAANYSGVPGGLDVHALDDTYNGGSSGLSPVSIDIAAVGSSVSTTAATLNTEVAPVADPPAFEALAVNYLADSLTGISIDNSHWNVVLPSVPGTDDDASVTPTANGVVLHDHGYLETTSGFTPTAATPLHASLSFSLDDGVGPYVAVTDGTDGTTGTYGSPANGLSFMFGWGNGLIITNNATGANVNLSASLSQGTVYDATITDDGSHQTVVIVDHSTGQTVGTYTSDFTDYAAGNLVTITNREANDGQHDATVSNVTISNAFEGEHGTAIALPSLTAVIDTDGSEHMSLDLSGFPDGTTFSVGQAGIGDEAGHWLVSAPDIASLGTSALTLTTPTDYAGEFSLHVSGTVVDRATGLSGPLSDTETFTNDVAVKVDGAPAGGPVIDTDHFYVSHDRELGTDTITNLSVTDSDSGASTDEFKVTAVTVHAPGSSVDLSPSCGTLDDINTAFENGVTYSAGETPPDADQITLTVTDKTTGLSDTVNFIFNEGDASHGVTLNGTSGKDVIFATTTGDTLSGGGGKDQFVFTPGSAGYDDEGHPVADYAHTITDFIEGVDRIDLRQFSGVSSIGNLSITQQNGETLVAWQQQIGAGDSSVTEHEQLLLKSMTATLKASDFIFHIT